MLDLKHSDIVNTIHLVVYATETIQLCLSQPQPPPRQASGRVLASSAGSIPSQGPRHTKDVIKMVPVVSLFSTQH